MPVIRNARLSEILLASDFLKIHFFSIFDVQIVKITIIDCAEYIGYSITFPMIGYSFLCDEYQWLYG